MSNVRTRAGQRLSERLADRAKRGLERKSMPGGGEVIGGPLAEEALHAVGARAMTMDRSIIVGRSFDPTTAEGQALYAHEMVHVEGSGGEAGHTVRDAEEVAARAAEAMVFHRMASDASRDDVGAGVDPSSDGGPDKEEEAERKPDPQQGYQALLEQGLSHEDIVAQLTRDCVTVIDDQAEIHRDREGDLLKLF